MFIVFLSFSHLLDHPAAPTMWALKLLILDYQVRLALFIFAIVLLLWLCTHLWISISHWFWFLYQFTFSIKVRKYYSENGDPLQYNWLLDMALFKPSCFNFSGPMVFFRCIIMLEFVFMLLTGSKIAKHLEWVIL